MKRAVKIRAFSPSASGDSLAQRIVKILGDSGPRPVQFFRSFAVNQAVFEQAVGILFIKGRVKFKGMTSGRVLALNGRRSG